MFSDPFTSVMALILLAFIGALAVFFRLWRELDALRASLRDIQDALQLYAVDATQQSRDLAALLREVRVRNGGDGGPGPDKDIGELLERGLPNLEREGLGPLHGPRGTTTPPTDGADIFRNFNADAFRKKP